MLAKRNKTIASEHLTEPTGWPISLSHYFRNRLMA